MKGTMHMLTTKTVAVRGLIAVLGAVLLTFGLVDIASAATTVTYTAQSGTYTSQASSGTNFCGATATIANNSSVTGKRLYHAFTTSVPAGNTITGATLKIWSQQTNSTKVNAYQQTTWQNFPSGCAVTWANQPVAGPLAGTSPAGQTKNAYTSIPINPALIPTAGTVGLMVNSQGTSDLKFDNDCGGCHRPQLVVTYAPNTVVTAPTVVTGSATGLSATGATLNGTVNPNGGATTYHFEYGPTTAYGTSVPVPDGSAGSGTSAVAESATISGLTASTTYHFRLVATNSVGATNGADATFTTSATGTSGCTNSDGTPCPASYFSGPLGANNIVPSKAGALLIEYYGGIPTTWAQKQAGIQSRQTFTGRKFDGIHLQYCGDCSWGGVYGMEDPASYSPRMEQFSIDNGSYTLISWQPDYTIADINNGAADAIYAKAANYWKTYAPNRIIIRPFIEFNLPSKSSAVPSTSNGNINSCGAPFISAWQRMVNIFKQNGATNVGFWFTPDEGNNRQCVIDSYPGDAYVDWVGSDSYNRSAVGDTGSYSTPLHSGWATFGELFGYTGTCADGNTCPPSQHDLFGPKKPFVVGEVGTIYDPNSTTAKGDFFRTMASGAKTMKYLRGVSFFDQDVSAAEGSSANWWVDYPTSNPDPYNGFKQNAADPWFNAR